MQTLKDVVKRIPLVGQMATSASNKLRQPRFSSASYWESRYQEGKDSGAGSYGRLATFKAEVLNAFIAQHAIASVIEFGCGDGNQLELLAPPQYLGLDVSPRAIQLCKAAFAGDTSKSFYLYDPLALVDHAQLFRAELALSLDVVFHLVEDHVFEHYMHQVFAAGTRFVIVYASNHDQRQSLHVRHRHFTPWVERHCPAWALVDTIPNRYPYDPAQPDTTSPANFYVYAPRE